MEADGMDNTPKLLTVIQAANALNLGRSKFYELIQRKQVRSVTIGRKRLIPPQALDEYLERLNEEQVDF